MDASSWTNLWLFLIVVALFCMYGKIRSLARSVGSPKSTSTDSLRDAVGSCVKMTFTTGSKDTVRILDIDDYCVLAESVYASSRSSPCGSRRTAFGASQPVPRCALRRREETAGATDRRVAKKNKRPAYQRASYPV